jgi:hypothetical protein
MAHESGQEQGVPRFERDSQQDRLSDSGTESRSLDFSQPLSGNTTWVDNGQGHVLRLLGLWATRIGEVRCAASDFEDREFQLITWSKDRTLRIWPMNNEIMERVGYRYGAPIKVLISRRGAADLTKVGILAAPTSPDKLFHHVVVSFKRLHRLGGLRTEHIEGVGAPLRERQHTVAEREVARTPYGVRSRDGLGDLLAR